MEDYIDLEFLEDVLWRLRASLMNFYEISTFWFMDLINNLFGNKN